eukprot:750011-Hanusia_phi.AAC.1
MQERMGSSNGMKARGKRRRRREGNRRAGCSVGVDRFGSSYTLDPDYYRTCALVKWDSAVPRPSKKPQGVHFTCGCQSRDVVVKSNLTHLYHGNVSNLSWVVYHKQLPFAAVAR